MIISYIMTHRNKVSVAPFLVKNHQEWGIDGNKINAIRPIFSNFKINNNSDYYGVFEINSRKRKGITIDFTEHPTSKRYPSIDIYRWNDKDDEIGERIDSLYEVKKFRIGDKYKLPNGKYCMIIYYYGEKNKEWLRSIKIKSKYGGRGEIFKKYRDEDEEFENIDGNIIETKPNSGCLIQKISLESYNIENIDHKNVDNFHIYTKIY